MLVWDIMGEKGFRALLRDAYFEGSHGVIAVCDMTRKETLYDLNNWVQMIRKQVGDVPIVFLGNKMDLKERLVVSEDDLAGISTVHSAPHYLSSARSGSGVNDAFKSLAEAIRHRGEG
jgi:Ras-related protein Rab-8A